MASRLNVSHETFRQLVRFALVGFFLAGVYSAIYWYLATYVMPPMAAVVIAFLVSVSIGFFSTAAGASAATARARTGE